MGKTAIDVACVAGSIVSTHEIKFWRRSQQVSSEAERKMKTLFCVHLQYHHTANHTARYAAYYKWFLQMLPKHLDFFNNIRHRMGFRVGRKIFWQKTDILQNLFPLLVSYCGINRPVLIYFKNQNWSKTFSLKLWTSVQGFGE